MDNISKIFLNMYFLAIFKNLKEDIVIKNFLEFLNVLINSDNFKDNIEAYSAYVSSLYDKKEINFSNYLKLKIENKGNITDKIQAQKELKILEELSKIDFNSIKKILEDKFPYQKEYLDNLAPYKTSALVFAVENIKDSIFSLSKTFIFNTNLKIEPVEIIEDIKFSDLKGYKSQKKILYDNTRALLEGKKVNNILLYGDAGCGKSSSVRALLGEFEELKIIQIFKNNLSNLDKLYETLKNIPYKFIIFADDISFDETDETISTTKAILEGSLIQCPKNAVLYMTSNRRRLIKESFQSRVGNEIHLNDTINEVSSLSERFGITILFQKPSNDEFNAIVIELAKDNNINLDEKSLIEKAQRLALVKGSKSPRIARQLIDNLLANVSV